MLRMSAVLLLFLAGCSGVWQANSASQAVDINPAALGTGNPVFTPSNAPGFINGEPQNLKTR